MKKPRKLSDNQKRVLEYYGKSEWRAVQSSDKQTIMSLYARNLLELDPSIGPDGSVRANPEKKPGQHAFRITIKPKGMNKDKSSFMGEFDGQKYFESAKYEKYVKAYFVDQKVSYENFNNRQKVIDVILSRYLSATKDSKFGLHDLDIKIKDIPNESKAQQHYLNSDFNRIRKPNSYTVLRYVLNYEESQAYHKRLQNHGFELSTIFYNRIAAIVKVRHGYHEGTTILVRVSTDMVNAQKSEIEYILNRFINHCVKEFHADPEEVKPGETIDDTIDDIELLF